MNVEEQIINAIQNIVDSYNVQDSLKVLAEIDTKVEKGVLGLDSFKLSYKKHFDNSESEIQELFNVLFLDHDRIKVLYLLKGFKLIIYKTNPMDLSLTEKELVRNLVRTVSDKGVTEPFHKVLKDAKLFSLYERIINRIRL